VFILWLKLSNKLQVAAHYFIQFSSAETSKSIIKKYTKRLYFDLKIESFLQRLLRKILQEKKCIYCLYSVHTRMFRPAFFFLQNRELFRISWTYFLISKDLIPEKGCKDGRKRSEFFILL